MTYKPLTLIKKKSVNRFVKLHSFLIELWSFRGLMVFLNEKTVLCVLLTDLVPATYTLDDITLRRLSSTMLKGLLSQLLFNGC